MDLETKKSSNHEVPCQMEEPTSGRGGMGIWVLDVEAPIISKVLRTVIAQVLVWENPDPTTNWWQLREHLPTVTLCKCSHKFIGEVVTSRRESRWPRGDWDGKRDVGMDAPKGQVSRWKRELGNEYLGFLKVSNDLSDLPRESTFPRHKHNQVYNAIYQMNKQVKLAVPNSSC